MVQRALSGRCGHVGVGPSFEQPADSLGVHPLTCGEEDGPVVFAEGARGIGPVFDQQVSSVKSAQPHRLSKGLIEIGLAAFGGEVTDLIEVGAGRGKKERRIVALHSFEIVVGCPYG